MLISASGPTLFKGLLGDGRLVEDGFREGGRPLPQDFSSCHPKLRVSLLDPSNSQECVPFDSLSYLRPSPVF